MVTIRPVHWEHDLPALAQLETGFETRVIYKVLPGELGFSLQPEPVDPPVRKSFGSLAGEPDLRDLPFAVVAEADGKLAGFAAATGLEWNKRVALWHLYVNPDHRGQGVGRRLIEATTEYAQTVGARTIWLETQNINYPAVQFYRRLGFTLCGLDLDLYDPEGPAGGEVALYFSRPVR